MGRSKPPSGRAAPSKTNKSRPASKSREPITVRVESKVSKRATNSRGASKKAQERSTSSERSEQKPKRPSPARKGTLKVRPNSRTKVPEDMDEEKQPSKGKKPQKQAAPAKSDSDSLFSEEPEEVSKDGDDSLVDSEDASIGMEAEEDNDDISDEIKPKKRNASANNTRRATSVTAKSKNAPKGTGGSKKASRPATKKAKRDNTSQSELIRDEQRKVLAEMVEFFMAYLKDKNEPGITVNSLLKFMKTNSITGKDRKMEIDENIAERMVLHLLRMIGITPKYSKPEELVVSPEQLRNFVMSETRFHLGVMKKVLKV